MSRLFLPWLGFLPLIVLVGCGGGGAGPSAAPGTAAPTAAPPTFRELSIPSGFSPGTASMKTVQVDAARLAAAGGLPAGHADARIYTWVTFSYRDAAGQARTLGILRWTSLAALGSPGLRLELPAQVTALNFEIYNANGTKTGSLTV